MNLVRLWQNTFSSSPQAENAEDRQEENDFLPGELAGQILDLEIDCEGPNACKELIGELIAHYAVIMQSFRMPSSSTRPKAVRSTKSTANVCNHFCPAPA